MQPLSGRTKHSIAGVICIVEVNILSAVAQSGYSEAAEVGETAQLVV
jgi:hypothetical protein